jgi:hypothetical protein
MNYPTADNFDAHSHVDCDYDEVTKISTVAIHNDYGYFVGSAIPCEEDYEDASFILGGTIAEMRAWLEYYKERRRVAKAQMKELKLAINAFESMREAEDYKRPINWLHREFKDLENELESWNKMIETIEIAINNTLGRK